jgi:hypothetical protein
LGGKLVEETNQKETTAVTQGSMAAVEEDVEVALFGSTPKKGKKTRNNASTPAKKKDVSSYTYFISSLSTKNSSFC